MDATRCISMYYIYIHRRRRIVASSSSHRRRAHIRMHPSRATPTRASMHPSIHPSTHPSTARRDATRRFPRRLDDAQKITRAKILRRIYDANTTYLDLRRLEGGDAGDEGGREEGRHRVCESVRECRDARRDRGGGGGRRHDDSDIRRRNDDSDIRRMHGDARAGRLPRPWSWSSSVDGTPRARGRDWSHF